jgi:sulfatase maturation enzyme AslB (radical SAM superfamily)
MDSLNEAQMEDLRQAMLGRKMIPGCRICYLSEQAGAESPRISFNDLYGRPNKVKLRNLDVSLGNLCNFKCRTCNSAYSSKWVNDEIALGLNPTAVQRRNGEHLRGLDLSMVDLLKFKGGETLLEQDAMCDILDMFSSVQGGLSGLTVAISTNGSTPLSSRSLELLSSCYQVKLTVSADGLGKINDYQRTGCEWSQLSNEMVRMQETLPASFVLSIYSVWSMLNINCISEFYHWVADTLPRYKTFGTVLLHPPEMSIRNMPNDMKAHHLSKIRGWDLMDHNRDVRDLIKLVLSELVTPSSMPLSAVRKKIDDLDRLRRESFADIDPLMYRAITDG